MRNQLIQSDTHTIPTSLYKIAYIFTPIPSTTQANPEPQSLTKKQKATKAVVSALLIIIQERQSDLHFQQCGNGATI
jgi:hypothetical protein